MSDESSNEFDLEYTGDDGGAGSDAGTDTEAAGAQQETAVNYGNGGDGGTPAAPGGEAAKQPEPTEADDLESLRSQLAAAQLELLKMRNSFAGQQAPAMPQPAAQPQQAPAPQAPQGMPMQPQQAFGYGPEVSDLDFIGEADHLGILEDRAKFNGLLNKLATVVFNASVNAAQERILRQIPRVVDTAANQQMQIRDIVGRFYAANADLAAYKPAVSMAAIQLHNENPNMPLEEMLTKAAQKTREVLRIRPGGQRQRVPAQPVGRGRVGADRAVRSPSLTDQEQQILDLLS